jgi:hypothetical protein
MRVLRGKVVSGQIVVDARLEEGAQVTVLVSDERPLLRTPPPRPRREDRSEEVLRDLGGEG